MSAKFVILYTHQKTKKQKTWQDGTLTISKDGTKGTLKNDGGQNIDTIRIKKETNIGDDLESAKYLIQIDDVCFADFDKNSSTQEQEKNTNYNSQKADNKNPRFRNKLPKLPKRAPVVGDPNLQSNTDHGQNSDPKFLKCSTNLTKRCSESKDEEKSGAGEGEDPQSVAKVKKRKKFCVPRRVVACTDSQDSIPSWNENSQEEEMSGMTCTVVRQDPNGIFRTIQYNQPPDVSKAPVRIRHRQSLIAAKNRRLLGGAGPSYSIVNDGKESHDGTKDDNSFNSIRNCEALGGTRTYSPFDGAKVKKTSEMGMTQPVNNFSIEADTHEEKNTLLHVNPIRSAREVLEIIKRAKTRKNLNTNIATKGALDRGSDMTPRGQNIFKCRPESEERTSFRKMKTDLESATVREEIPTMHEVSAPNPELKITNIPVNIVSKEDGSIPDCDSNSAVGNDDIVGDNSSLSCAKNESSKSLEYDNPAPLPYSPRQGNIPPKGFDVSIGNRNPIFSIDEDDSGQDVAPDFDFALEIDV